MPTLQTGHAIGFAHTTGEAQPGHLDPKAMQLTPVGRCRSLYKSPWRTAGEFFHPPELP